MLLICIAYMCVCVCVCIEHTPDITIMRKRFDIAESVKSPTKFGLFNSSIFYFTKRSADADGEKSVASWKLFT